MALPWANPPPAIAADNESVEDHQEPLSWAGKCLADVQLQEGAEIEVRWTIEQFDESGTETKRLVWWGGKILGKAAAEGQAAQGPTFEVLYEPRESFPEETAIVAFMDDHLLCAIGHEGGEAAMYWRHKGDQWDASDSDDEEQEQEEEGDAGEGEPRSEGSKPKRTLLEARLNEAGVQPDDDDTYAAGDVLGVLAASGRDQPNSILSGLDGLDPYQQRIVAEGVRALVDSMEEVYSEAGRPLTSDDVKAAFARATQKRQRRE